MSEADQNRKINAIHRENRTLHEKVRALEAAIEPDGYIAQAFDRLAADNTELFKRLDRQSHQLNLLFARQETILQAITKVDDLPEE